MLLNDTQWLFNDELSNIWGGRGLFSNSLQVPHSPSPSCIHFGYGQSTREPSLFPRVHMRQGKNAKPTILNGLSTSWVICLLSI